MDTAVLSGTEAPACLSLPRSPLALPSTPPPSTARAPDCVCVCIFAVPRLAPHHHVSLCSSCLASHCLSPLSQCSSLSFHLPLHSALSVSRNRARLLCLRQGTHLSFGALWLKSLHPFPPRPSRPSFFTLLYYVSSILLLVIAQPFSSISFRDSLRFTSSCVYIPPLPSVTLMCNDALL